MKLMLLIIFLGPVAFGVCIFISASAVRAVKKGKYSVVLFFGHILYYMFFSFYYFLQPYDAQSELLWTIPLLVDLPSSGILFVLCHCSFFFRIIAMGILGTLQYALIGRLIDRARDHQEKNKEKASENGTE